MKSNGMEKLLQLIGYANENNTNGYLDSLIEALSNCELNIENINGFARSFSRSLVRYTFKVPDDNTYEQLCVDKERLIKFCEELLEDAFEFEIDDDANSNIIIKKVQKIAKLPVVPKVSFERCENVILQNLQKAEHSIIAVVAWFNNQKIMDVLKKKAQEGVLIFVIVDSGNEQDQINRQFLSSNTPLRFPVCLAENMRGIYKNLVHHKFCIIDRKLVLHGTCNWTNKAKYNNEDLTEDRNEETINSFLNQFKNLRITYNCFFDYSY